MKNEIFMNRIFKPFEQGNSLTTQEHGGSGLGLSITKNFVELMSGKIVLESKLNVGTTFTLDIPFAKADDQEQIQGNSMPKMWAILIDDDSDALEYAGTILNHIGVEYDQAESEMVGFTVDTANNGQEGIEKFEASAARTYDGILMDIQMPVMNGYEAAKAIRRSNHPDASSVLIVAMTANAFAEDIAKSLESGMNDHLSKPIDTEVMYQVLARHLNK